MNDIRTRTMQVADTFAFGRSMGATREALIALKAAGVPDTAVLTITDATLFGPLEGKRITATWEGDTE